MDRWHVNMQYPTLDACGRPCLTVLFLQIRTNKGSTLFAEDQDYVQVAPKHTSVIQTMDKDSEVRLYLQLLYRL